MPFEEDKYRRHFENKNGLVENEYNKIINNCTFAFQINEKDEAYLEAFVAGMICRSIFNRELFIEIIKLTSTRDKFLNEISLFKGDKDELKSLLNKIPLELQINIVLCELVEHLRYLFLSFNKVILKSPEGYHWTTSDNPVVIDRKEIYDWTIPAEAELYFPLSKDFCLFMYHKKVSIGDNQLRNLPNNKVSKIDFETFNSIQWNQLLTNKVSYHIFSGKFEPYNFKEGKPVYNRECSESKQNN